MGPLEIFHVKEMLLCRILQLQHKPIAAKFREVFIFSEHIHCPIEKYIYSLNGESIDYLFLKCFPEIS